MAPFSQEMEPPQLPGRFTSIPHLDPSDLLTLPVVRLGRQREKEIAALSERAILLNAQADMLENDLANIAETLIDRFLAGDCRDFAHKSCYAVA
jgi:hypothetical protein